MKEYLFNDKDFIELLKDNRLIVIDGGARGTVFNPMNFINKAVIQVIRFEPDADATIVNNSDDIVISKALWNKSQAIDVNIAIESSSSSVYPFNSKLQQYIDPQVDTRKTKKRITVDAISIDECLEEYDIKTIDFIKLDIHGAEYETLEGASKALKNTLGLLIESWIIPVHIEQKTRGDVERLALDNGFYVFEENVVAKWGRNSNSFLKRQPVAVDTLFFNDTLLNDSVTSKVKMIKLIGLADLFRHYGFAVQLTKYGVEKGLINKSLGNKIFNHLKKQGKITLADRVREKLMRLLNEKNECAFK
jgi:FkbM family methyltransferase